MFSNTRSSASAFVATIFLFTSPTYSDDLHINVERIENCMEFSQNRYECIGLAAGVCSGLPSGGSLKGMQTCTELERAYWIAHANDTLSELRTIAAAVDKSREGNPNHIGINAGVTDMHRGWENFRDAICTIKDQGQEDGALSKSHCLMQQDAEQALYLLDISIEHF